MKKVLKVLTLILAVCMTATFMFACAKAPDAKTAKKNLTSEDYEVVKMTAKDEEFEYMKVYMKELGAITKNFETVLVGQNEDGDMIYAVLYEEKADAKDTFENVEKNLDDFIDYLEEELGLTKEDLRPFKKLVPERIGNWVVLGNEDAIEIFKGE